MKIAMFTDTYRPQINGVVTSIDMFARALRKMGHVVEIFAPEMPGAREDRFVYHFSSVPFKPYKGYRVAVPYEFITDRRFKTVDFDVIHVHSPFSIGALGLGVAKYYSIPSVGTFHTLFPEYIHYAIQNERLQKISEVRILFKRFAWGYMKWFYNQCNEVIAPSDDIKNILLGRGIKKPVNMIPTGLDIKKYRSFNASSLKSRYRLSGKKIILHVGRVTKEKNIDFIVNNLAGFLKTHRDVRLVIASDGPYKEEIQSLVRKCGIENSVLFTGYLSEKDLVSVYHLSDVLVMASGTETQGIVLAEASVTGLPTVVLDEPVISDFVRNYKTGVVSSENNFAASVGKILMRGKKDFNANCSKAAGDYDIKIYAKKMVELYKKMSG